MRSFVFKFDARAIYISENVLPVAVPSHSSRECFIFSAGTFLVFRDNAAAKCELGC